jgi:hypothetical protein
MKQKKSAPQCPQLKQGTNQFDNDTSKNNSIPLTQSTLNKGHQRNPSKQQANALPQRAYQIKPKSTIEKQLNPLKSVYMPKNSQKETQSDSDTLE